MNNKNNLKDFDHSKYLIQNDSDNFNPEFLPNIIKELTSVYNEISRDNVEYTEVQNQSLKLKQIIFKLQEQL